MSQPTFSPIPESGAVRATMPTPTPELARSKKPGLQRHASPASGANLGTPAPDAGYALTIANREVAKLRFEHDHDRHDVALGVALVAAKRASLVGRGPTLGDVHAAMDLFLLREIDVVSHQHSRPFAGLAHSYVSQRRFVDEVSDARLLALSASNVSK